jgi:Glycosyl transferase family 2
MSFFKRVLSALKPPTLSVSIITRNSGPRLANVITQARRFADEVVVGVDADSQDNTWEVATDLADTAYCFKHPNQLAPVHMLALQYCRGQWILRLDDDEHMEIGFEQIVSELLNTQLFTHYLLPRKWVVSLDPPQYMHASPWHPDYQLRLMRNDSKLVWKPPRYHSGLLVAGPGARDARFAILHYEPLMCTPENREQKLKTYREGGSNGAAENFYCEKVGERRSFQPLPSLRPIKPLRQWIDPEMKVLTIQKFPPWGCKIVDIAIPQRVTASQSVIVALEVINTGNMTWIPQSTGWPTLHIAFHIKSASGNTITWDGARIELGSLVLPNQATTILGSFTAPAEPGHYVLTWDMVSEGECWFEECGSETMDTPIVVVD